VLSEEGRDGRERGDRFIADHALVVGHGGGGELVLLREEGRVLVVDLDEIDRDPLRAHLQGGGGLERRGGRKGETIWRIRSRFS
jgi:hypothetical protein